MLPAAVEDQATTAATPCFGLTEQTALCALFCGKQ